MQYKIVWKNATFSIQVVKKLPRNDYENGIKDNDMLKYRLQREDYLHCVKSVQIQIFFWSAFSCIRTEYGDFFVNLRIQSEYRKIRTRKKSVCGHFSRSVDENTLHCLTLWPK